MMNKKLMQVFVLLLSLTFLSTAVFVKSACSATEKQSKSWWRIPYYHMLKASKNIEKKISVLQRKAYKLEKRKNRLEEKVTLLENEINSLQERQTKLSSVNPSTSNGEIDRTPYPFICPGCNFSDSDEFVGHDFTKAFLGHMTASNADMSDANFSNAKMRFSYLLNSNLQNANFTNADLFNAMLSGTDFTGACFKGTTLEKVTWIDDWYGAATCPDGSVPEKVGDTCLDHLNVEIFCPSDVQ